jgi:Disulfide bond formation protein DsbB
MPESQTLSSQQDEALVESSFSDQLLFWLSASSRYIAQLAATIATVGSLFMSEVLGWPPCILCWYQRIMMYPLAFIIPIGLARRDRKLHLYVLPLAVIGAFISLYHYGVTKRLVPSPPCVSNIPCENGWINWFGFINVPFLALIAFIVIIFTMLISTSISIDSEEEGDEQGVSANPLERFGPAVPVLVIIFGVLAAFGIATIVR